MFTTTENCTCRFAYAPKLWSSKLPSYVWMPIWVANSGLSLKRHSQNDLKILSTSGDIVALAINIVRTKLWKVQITKKGRKYCEETKQTGKYFHQEERTPIQWKRKLWHYTTKAIWDTYCRFIFNTRERLIHATQQQIMANEPIVNGINSKDVLAGRPGPEEALKFAKRLYVHGGNISNWNRIKRKTTPSSADEVCGLV